MSTSTPPPGTGSYVHPASPMLVFLVDSDPTDATAFLLSSLDEQEVFIVTGIGVTAIPSSALNKPPTRGWTCLRDINKCNAWNSDNEGELSPIKTSPPVNMPQTAGGSSRSPSANRQALTNVRTIRKSSSRKHFKPDRGLSSASQRKRRFEALKSAGVVSDPRTATPSTDRGPSHQGAGRAGGGVSRQTFTSDPHQVPSSHGWALGFECEPIKVMDNLSAFHDHAATSAFTADADREALLESWLQFRIPTIGGASAVQWLKNTDVDKLCIDLGTYQGTKSKPEALDPKALVERYLSSLDSAYDGNLEIVDGQQMCFLPWVTIDFAPNSNCMGVLYEGQHNSVPDTVPETLRSELSERLCQRMDMRLQLRVSALVEISGEDDHEDT